MRNNRLLLKALRIISEVIHRSYEQGEYVKAGWDDFPSFHCDMTVEERDQINEFYLVIKDKERSLAEDYSKGCKRYGPSLKDVCFKSTIDDRYVVYGGPHKGGHPGDLQVVYEHLIAYYFSQMKDRKIPKKHKPAVISVLQAA